jgi:hypothetical protein
VSNRSTGVIRPKTCFLVFACVERLQVSNVPVRDPSSHRCPDSAYVFLMVNHVERGNPVTSPEAISGRHYRKACCGRGRMEKLEEANAAGKAGG